MFPPDCVINYYCC